MSKEKGLYQLERFLKIVADDYRLKDGEWFILEVGFKRVGDTFTLQGPSLSLADHLKFREETGVTAGE